MNKEKNTEKEDNIVISNMNVEGFRWYDKRGKEEREKIKSMHITAKEKKAITRGIIVEYYKIVFSIIVSFALVFLIIFLWLKIL